MWTAVKEISMEATLEILNLSSSEIKVRYLHKVSDVYHCNYLMQCLKLIYVDGNRSLIQQR